MVTFFALIGFIGMCVGLAKSSDNDNCCNSCDTVDCYWCIWCDCNHYNTTGSNNLACCCCDCDGGGGGLDCNNCGNCECGDCGDGDAGAVVAVIAVVLCVILAFVGLLIAMAFLAVMVQSIMQRHMHILQKREYTKSFIVADLDGMDTGGFSRSYEPIEYASLFEGTVPEMPPPAYSPMASAPPMNQQEMDELYKIGLM